MTPDTWCSGTEHGTRRAYQRHGCRCAAARAQESAYQRARYADRKAGLGARLVAGVGTRRRLESLCRAGWPETIIAHRLGVTGAQVWQWRNGRSMRRRTARQIADLYAELSPIPGPSPYSRACGVRRGWALPSWWGDAIEDPDAVPVSPWQAIFAEQPRPLLLDRDVLDDHADRALDDALDAIEAEDEAWFDAQRSGAPRRKVYP